MFWKYFIFSWSQFTQRLRSNYGQVLGNIKRCSDRNIYQILLQALIRQTIKSSLKLSKHSQVQPLHYSASAFQNFYNSSQLSSCVLQFLEIFYISMLATWATQTLRNFYISMLRTCAKSRPIRPFLGKFRFWETKILNNLLREV